MNKVYKIVGCVCFLLGIAIVSCCVYYLRRYDGHLSKSMTVPAGHHLTTSNKELLRFAVIGDIKPELQNLDVALGEINKLAPDFVLCVGDMAKKPGDIRHMNWLSERISQKIPHIPFIPTPGNWDHDASIPMDDGLKAYLSIFGNANYFLSVNDTLLISIDTSTEELPQSSLDFLSTTLKMYRDIFRNCIVFTHVPPVDAPDAKHTDCLPREQSEQLLQIYDEYNISLLLCGHQHNYAQMHFGKTPLVINPSLDQESRSEDRKNGYLIVTLDNSGKYSSEFIEVHKQAKIRWNYFATSRINLSYGWCACGMIFICFGFFWVMLRKTCI